MELIIIGSILGLRLSGQDFSALLLRWPEAFRWEKKSNTFTDPWCAQAKRRHCYHGFLSWTRSCSRSLQRRCRLFPYDGIWCSRTAFNDWLCEWGNAKGSQTSSERKNHSWSSFLCPKHPFVISCSLTTDLLFWRDWRSKDLPRDRSDANSTESDHRYHSKLLFQWISYNQGCRPQNRLSTYSCPLAKNWICLKKRTWRFDDLGSRAGYSSKRVICFGQRNFGGPPRVSASPQARKWWWAVETHRLEVRILLFYSSSDESCFNFFFWNEQKNRSVRPLCCQSWSKNEACA